MPHPSEVDSYSSGAATTTSYQYDPLKRLTSAALAQTSGTGFAPWTETFQYDGFSNLTERVMNGASTPIPVNGATNRLTNAYYDANGNMTSGAGATFTYDEANRVTTVTETSGGEMFYGYDASNKRIYQRNSSNGVETFAFYGAKGENLGKYGITNECYPAANLCLQAQSTNLWFAGRLVATTSNIDYAPMGYWDRLGTNRQSGSYLPYGEGAGGTDSVQFATYTRDSYTGIDYADQRFYASTYGRFLTADPFQGVAKGASDQSTPGSWNKYAYTLGDPVNNVDPQGMFLASCAPDGAPCDPGIGFGSAPCTPLTVESTDPEPCSLSEPEQPATPTVSCEIGEFYRKAFSKKLSVWYHTFLEASCTFTFSNGSFTTTQVIQADPGPKPNAAHPPRVGGLSGPWLIGVITTPYAGPGHSAASALGTSEVGSLEPIPYSELLQIDDAVNVYDYNPQPYVLFPLGSDSYNSNSFIYTLDVNFNLGFAMPPANVPGRGNCVPNLPYPTCSTSP